MPRERASAQCSVKYPNIGCFKTSDVFSQPNIRCVIVNRHSPLVQYSKSAYIFHKPNKKQTFRRVNCLRKVAETFWSNCDKFIVRPYFR
ncbi:hypothetical protein D9V87_03875 [Bacteroidetes/Chlorobi group bacterium MS-B_bin-24]|nr:MAG: hypothetical protein D9V87_03875 [Bacteroidetes/Chlorobi group bacterium MS-B_bin-24]